jgi:hypothetical protein
MKNLTNQQARLDVDPYRRMYEYYVRIPERFYTQTHLEIIRWLLERQIHRPRPNRTRLRGWLSHPPAVNPQRGSWGVNTDANAGLTENRPKSTQPVNHALCLLTALWRSLPREPEKERSRAKNGASAIALAISGDGCEERCPGSAIAQTPANTGPQTTKPRGIASGLLLNAAPTWCPWAGLLGSG